MRKPWWFCCRWRSYWCVLDVIQHKLPGRTIKWICDRHDANIWRVFDDVLDASEAAELSVKRDWLDDPDVTPDERMAQFNALGPVPTTGPGSHPNFYVSAATNTSGSSASVTWNWKP